VSTATEARRLGAVDMHSYVAPGVELLYEHGTPEFRSQWPRIEAQLGLVRPRPGTGDWEAPYLCLGVVPEVSEPAAPRTTLDPVPVPRLSGDGGVAQGVLHDNPRGRVAALEAAGVSLQLISPGPGVDASAELGSALAVGMLGAYNRYAITYCGEDPGRLRAVLQVHGAEPHWSAREIRDLAGAREVAGVTVHLPVRIAPDDRNFRPVWEALTETRLPLVHRPSCGAKVWSADRLLAYLIHSGVLERHPGLRIACVESSAAQWLPRLIARLPEPSSTSPSDAGRRLQELLVARQVCAAVGADDDPRELALITSRVGTDCLVWQSHFPFGPTTGGIPLTAPPPDGSLAMLSENGARFLAGGAPVAPGPLAPRSGQQRAEGGRTPAHGSEIPAASAPA
jgi:hypothetical protein